MSLVSRYLENNLIPTVVLGSARDIVEHAGVARFLFVDYPLGNPAGFPYDRNNQEQIAEMAVSLLEQAEGPNTTVRAPFEWPGSSGWREVYNRIHPDEKEALLEEGDRRRERFSKIPRRNL